VFPGVGRSPPGNIRAKEVSGRLRRSNGIRSKVVSGPSSPKASTVNKGWASLWVARALQDSAVKYKFSASSAEVPQGEALQVALTVTKAVNFMLADNQHCCGIYSYYWYCRD
jgi:hypothetical protein